MAKTNFAGLLSGPVKPIAEEAVQPKPRRQRATPAQPKATKAKRGRPASGDPRVIITIGVPASLQEQIKELATVNNTNPHDLAKGLLSEAVKQFAAGQFKITPKTTNKYG